jgi:hypothetical protein
VRSFGKKSNPRIAPSSSEAKAKINNKLLSVARIDLGQVQWMAFWYFKNCKEEQE